MQSINQSGMSVIVLTQPGPRNEESIYRSMKPRLAKQLIGLGVIHTLIGVCCITFQSISLDIYVKVDYYYISTLSFFGHGVWNGFLFLVTGIIGITTGIGKRRCQVITFLVFSIVSAAFTLILLILAVVSANMTNRYLQDLMNCGSSYCKSRSFDQLKKMIAMDSLLAIMAILESIVAIWSSVVCCVIGACSCCRASPSQTQQQPMILSSEQQAAMMSNPMFMSNQQQQMIGFNPNQQYNRQLPNFPSYFQQSWAHGSSMSAEAAEGAYTRLNIGMNRSLPFPPSNAEACVTTSVYEELHDYDEIVQPLKP